MKTAAQKILVTGVAGFLGSHLSEKLSLMGHNVIGVDNMSGGYKDNIPSHIKFFNFDCCDLEKMNKIMKLLLAFATSILFFNNSANANEYSGPDLSGQKVTISGPYGDFFIKDTDREMVYLGGGAGMAPMRSHLFHLFYTLKTEREVTYWYGARSRREMFYDNDFKKIQ